MGGSLMVTIPKELADALGIKEGEIVSIEVKKLRRDFFGALRNLSPMATEEELHSHE
ncbi:hypothetical protein HRbin02_00954 [Candidatus Calditenuaceae archaeon HR02]|nr:hypothetical protein HRbin02_00954 [Candidatus Calditenuaceae archaeon HR02]